MNTICSLQQVDEQFGLNKTIDRPFFTEWYQNLPTLTVAEEANCEFHNHSAPGSSLFVPT